MSRADKAAASFAARQLLLPLAEPEAAAELVARCVLCRAPRAASPRAKRSAAREVPICAACFAKLHAATGDPDERR